MGTLDDLRAALAEYDSRGCMAPARVIGSLRAFLAALPDSPEVPEGKVLVDEGAYRAAIDWIQSETDDGDVVEGWHTSHDQDGALEAALPVLVAALPAPEWEPSDELVERITVALWPDLYVAAAEDRSGLLQRQTARIKRLHAAGLLNPEVTDG